MICRSLCCQQHQVKGVSLCSTKAFHTLGIDLFGSRVSVTCFALSYVGTVTKRDPSFQNVIVLIFREM